MKLTTALNFLLFAVVIGEYAYLHNRSVQEKAFYEFHKLHIVGYRFDVVDARTGAPIPTLASVTASGVGTALTQSAQGAPGHVYLIGRWIGNLPETATVVAPRYKPKNVDIGDFPDEFRKLALTPE